MTKCVAHEDDERKWNTKNKQECWAMGCSRTITQEQLNHQGKVRVGPPASKGEERDGVKLTSTENVTDLVLPARKEGGTPLGHWVPNHQTSGIESSTTPPAPASS